MYIIKLIFVLKIGNYLF
jgi:hypothetical protein